MGFLNFYLLRSKAVDIGSRAGVRRMGALVCAFVGINLGGSLPAIATPKCVYLIRHAEKPEEKSDHLSARGFLRANELGRIFEDGRPMSEFDRPQLFVAAAYVPGVSSLRSIETLFPLAAETGASVLAEYRREQIKKLTKWILKAGQFEGQVVIVAWPHSELYRIARRLGGRPAEEWRDEVFDRVWVIDFESADHPRFYDVPQALFPGDSDK